MFAHIANQRSDPAKRGDASIHWRRQAAPGSATSPPPLTKRYLDPNIGPAFKRVLGWHALLADGLSLERVAAATGLSIEELRA